MSEPFVFDPRCDLCKTPFGAVPCGAELTFSCRPLQCEGFTHCALVERWEFSDSSRETELWDRGSAGDPTRDSRLFTLTLTAPAEPELVWYHFRFWRDDGSSCVLDKTGYRSDGQLEPWQLTVYRESPTPQWFGSGVTYQIFPDRFRRLSPPDPAGMVGERRVHLRWDEAQDWQPDAEGIVHNRDFFGGSLAGITEKLPYLAELGVSTLYLNPIFESASNHRYNTADYTRIDPMLGTEEDFQALCQAAEGLGIRILLDGVFNHTGSQSVYFNADGFYPGSGAAQSRESPYFSWFSFHPWPEDYESWWGIKTLPAVREDAPGYADYIIRNEDSVVRRWLRLGASGWRLDVADELPDWFITELRAAAAETRPDALVLGEVWEDASNKIAYHQRRRYLLGSELHGVMNYPFRTALLDFLRGGGAEHFVEAMETLRENYPPAAFYSAMNFLGTHDTPRILTLLGADTPPESKADRAVFRLSPAQRERGLARLRLAALILFTFPGSPTVYYGDEAGMEGWEDPFNRSTYPWGQEDAALLDFFRQLGQLRSRLPCLRQGSIRYLRGEGAVLAFVREDSSRRTVTAVNRGEEAACCPLPWQGDARDLLTGQRLSARDGGVILPPMSGWLLEECFT